MTEAPPQRRAVKKAIAAPVPPIKDSPPPPKDEPAIPPERVGKIGKWVTRQYQLIGKGLSITDPVCGAAIMQAADAAGPAWERLARENKVVRDVFLWLMQTTATTDVVLANLPILVTVLAHHVPSFREFIGRSSLAFMAEFAKAAESDSKAGDAAA